VDTSPICMAEVFKSISIIPSYT